MDRHRITDAHRPVAPSAGIRVAVMSKLWARRSLLRKGRRDSPNQGSEQSYIESSQNTKRMEDELNKTWETEVKERNCDDRASILSSKAKMPRQEECLIVGKFTHDEIKLGLHRFKDLGTMQEDARQRYADELLTKDALPPQPMQVRPLRSLPMQDLHEPQLQQERDSGALPNLSPEDAYALLKAASDDMSPLNVYADARGWDTAVQATEQPPQSAVSDESIEKDGFEDLYEVIDDLVDERHKDLVAGAVRRRPTDASKETSATHGEASLPGENGSQISGAGNEVYRASEIDEVSQSFPPPDRTRLLKLETEISAAEASKPSGITRNDSGYASRPRQSDGSLELPPSLESGNTGTTLGPSLLSCPLSPDLRRSLDRENDETIDLIKNMGKDIDLDLGFNFDGDADGDDGQSFCSFEKANPLKASNEGTLHGYPRYECQDGELYHDTSPEPPRKTCEYGTRDNNRESQSPTIATWNSPTNADGRYPKRSHHAHKPSQDSKVEETKSWIRSIQGLADLPNGTALEEWGYGTAFPHIYNDNEFGEGTDSIHTGGARAHRDTSEETDDDGDDESYPERLRQAATKNLGMTLTWLEQQTECETGSSNGQGPERDEKGKEKDDKDDDDAPTSARTGHLFLRVFQRHLAKITMQDILVHSHSRYETMHIERVVFREKHAERLSGVYDMCRTLQKHKGKGTSLPPDGPEREEALAERKRYIEAEKETEISNQLLPTLWAIDCMKFMMGGTLIKSPALREFESRRRQDKNLNGTTEAFRVLNLGGAPSCDWGWAIAITVPESEVTTVMHNSQNITPEIEGPKNHESMVVPHLWRLPFEDSSFDLISARSLHLYLRTQAPIGEVKDEYDLVLKECLRVLKPGGYLEYALPDCDIKGAGDQGTAISQTLADDLQELGYDPHPMSLIDKRLSDTGFIVPASAKIFLPMGPRLRSTTDGTDAPPEDISQKTEEAESSRTLSCISGLLGARIWEQWLLKVQMETGKDKAARLDEAMPILEEERPEDLTGWEVMMGWAKKPTQKKVAWA